MNESGPPRPGPWGSFAAIALGLVLIVIITPLSQFLTLMTVNADLETASPVGWAVGLVFSLVLANAVFLVLVRRRLFAPARLVLIYCMLTIAAPLMNLGLVRQYLLASTMVIREYESTNTYRTAYNALNPRWFPVVPTDEGLAWDRAARLLRLLRDPDLDRERHAARRLLETALASGAEPAPDPVARLGPDEAVQLWESLAGAGAPPVWRNALADRVRATREAGAAAAAVLPARLAGFDEFIASRHPAVYAALDASGRQRLDTEVDRLAPDERDAQDEALARYVAVHEDLRALVAALGAGDRARVRAELAAEGLRRLAALPAGARAAQRHSYVYRLNRSERAALLRQDGRDGPNQNLAAMTEGLWTDLPAQQARDRASLAENAWTVFTRLPWAVWLPPLLHWGVLLSAIFLFLMCLAEWLRRKWVDREHLAFPLVEMIDGAIRHDARLELAEDPCHPEPRRRRFYPLFTAGLIGGFGLLSLEALGHYGFTAGTFALEFNLSKELFSAGPLQEFVGLHFVISPIIVGLLFLVSLEISFSIWVTYLAYAATVWFFRISLPTLPADPIYTGWGGGRFFPFAMEQLLGAALAFALIVVVQTWRGARRDDPGHPAATYLPPRAMRLGLVVLPLLVVALLWDFGLTHLPFVFFICLCALGLTIAAARVRAETGLPTHHTTYEFAKLPLIFGLTGQIGATVYTRFITLAFLPVTLLFRTLPQQLENLELARRHRLSYRLVALATLAAFLTALAWGAVSGLLHAYAFGDRFTGAQVYPGQGDANNLQIAHYPLWVSHFLGEAGLDQFDRVHGIRLAFAGLGAGLVLALTLLRRRFLGFPLHPIGYLLTLLGIFFLWVSPYARGGGLTEADHPETTYLWGGALVAWLAKSLIVKYGGMNAYKRAKPLFIGLVAGAVFAVFAWNMADLAASLADDPPGLMKPFQDRPPYSPRFY